MKALFILNAATENRGCEAILLSTYEMLSSAYPGAEFINSSFRDDRAENMAYLRLPRLRHRCHPAPHTWPWIRWQVAKRIQGHEFNFERFLPWASLVLSLGGDNYSMDYGSAQTYFRANERVLAAGKKLVIWGASVGPFDQDPELEAYATEHLRRVHRIVVRESYSQRYLAGIGVTSNVTLLPDPAFSLRAEATELPPAIERMIESGALGVNLTPLLGRYRDEPGQWVDEAANWVSALVGQLESPVLLIPHVMQPGNDDMAFLAEVRARVSAPTGRLQLLEGYDLSSRQLKGVISRLRAFVGARTHATIAALSTNVPTLSIGYSVKARGINRDLFGHEDWVVDHLGLCAVQLLEKTRQLLGVERELRAMLAARNAAYRISPNRLAEILA